MRRLRCSTCGGPSTADCAAVLRDEFAGLSLAREHFPMWTDWGVEDESVAVHSLGLSYLTSLGQRAAYACYSEYPVAGHRIRADSIWWDKATRDPVALFEFERHKDGSELAEKVQNLLLAYHSLDCKPEILCLVFWSRNFYPLGDTGVSPLWRIFERGFVTEERNRIAPARASLLQVYECLHDDAGAGRHTLRGIAERRHP